MRLLLDENLPKHLRADFPGHDVFTVRYKGWNGIKNGSLLKLMVEDSFQALLTYDQNIEYQQNFAKYTVTVFILIAASNAYEDLTLLSPQVSEYLDSGNLPAGPVKIYPPASLKT